MRSRQTLAMPSPSLATFNPTPSVERAGMVAVTTARSVPDDAGAVGVPVGVKGPVPRQIGLDRSTLAASGFDGKVGQTLVVPRKGGPTVIAVGVGDPGELTPATRRDAAAAFARAAGKHERLATHSPTPAMAMPRPRPKPSSRACCSRGTATRR